LVRRLKAHPRIVTARVRVPREGDHQDRRIVIAWIGIVIEKPRP
jgi:hypothetical protein